MNDDKHSPRRRNTKNSLERSLGFLEELTWLLETYRDVDAKSVRDIRSQVMHGFLLQGESLQRFRPENPNVFFLVGTLPAFFMDEDIFASNEDISEFARDTLGIEISRWEKKSKFEIIGHIVCIAATLDDRSIDRVVLALEKVAARDYGARTLIQERKKTGLSWNEVIQELNREQR